MPANDPAYNSPAEPEPTPAELADPPAGEIRKIHLRCVNNLKGMMATLLASVPAGELGQASPWFAKAQAYKVGLETLAGSRKQSDCFALIPLIAELLAVNDQSPDGPAVPGFAYQARGLANGVGSVLIYVMADYIAEQAGVLPVPKLKSFIRVFSLRGYYAEGDWEGEPMPVDESGLMITDPMAVVAHLKTRPWQEADQFIGGSPTSEAFARYATDGNGLTILKTKYAANKIAIEAKWDELIKWVASKKPPDAP